jgi:hypothetical protein
MDTYYDPTTDHFLESTSPSCTTMATLEKMDMYEKLNNTLESKIKLEKNEQVQDNDLQTSTVSCVSKMDYTLPKYRNDVSPAIDKLMQMMSMPSLIASENSSSDLATPNCIFSSNYCCGGNENFVFPIAAKEHFDICFSSPKPYKKHSAEIRTLTRMQKETDSLFFQIAQEPVSLKSQEIANSLPNANSEVKEITRYITFRNRKQITK